MNNNELVAAYNKAFAAEAGETQGLYLAEAPGRVNLIGEHTDYNEGFVMPIALDVRVGIVFLPAQDSEVSLYSLNFEEHDTFDASATIEKCEHPWANYMRGIYAQLHNRGHKNLRGMKAIVWGNVPLGGGLSSSAALEVATVLAVCQCSGLDIDPVEQVKIAQACENEFIGVQCGIMDQFISRMGKAGKALILDCKDLSTTYVPLSDDVKILIANTGVKHSLGDSEFNTRRTECEGAVKILQAVLPRINSLRDVTMDELNEHKDLLSADVFKRAKHVIAENGRVQSAIGALAEGDFSDFGQSMNQSHDSLRDDYLVSCKELDVMVDIARGLDGVLGSRMTGGGFGGSTVSLVLADKVVEVGETLAAAYKKATGITADIIVSPAQSGAQVIAV